MSLYTNMMDSSGFLERPTATRDSAQGTGQVFNKIASDVPCCVNQMSASAKLLYAQRGVSVDVEIFFLSNLLTAVNDRFTATQSRSGEVTVYLITGQCQPVARSRLWKVQAEFLSLGA